MASSTLPNRLIHEAKQSPGKAAFLAGGAALAIYMWTPMLLGWFGSPAQQSAADSNMVRSTDVPPNGVEEVTEEARWYQQYQDFQATKMLEPWKPEMGSNRVTTDAAETQEVVSHWNPDDQKKLLLTAVLIGGRTGHLANLNGRVVREGDQFWLDFNAKEPQPTYHNPVDSIDARWVRVKIERIHANQIEVDVGGFTTTIPVRSQSN